MVLFVPKFFGGIVIFKVIIMRFLNNISLPIPKIIKFNHFINIFDIFSRENRPFIGINIVIFIEICMFACAFTLTIGNKAFWFSFAQVCGTMCVFIGCTSSGI
jgi:hypothetical protein